MASPAMKRANKAGGDVSRKRTRIGMATRLVSHRFICESSIQHSCPLSPECGGNLYRIRAAGKPAARFV